MKIVTPEDVEKVVGNKYLGVLVAAKYARELNLLPLERSPYGAEKLTTIALETLASGGIDYRLVVRRTNGTD